MCSGLFGGGRKSPTIYMPPPPPNPNLEARETLAREEGLQDQQKATKARKKQIQEGFGRRSLLTSSGGGYLSNTNNNTNLS